MGLNINININTNKILLKLTIVLIFRQLSLGEIVELAGASEEEVCSIDMEQDKRSNIETGEVFFRWSRDSQQIITELLVSTLDKCKVSDREAMHLISTVANALGYDLNHLVLNRSSLQRVHRDLRQKKAEKIKKRL